MQDTEVVGVSAESEHAEPTTDDEQQSLEDRLTELENLVDVLRNKAQVAEDRAAAAEAEAEAAIERAEAAEARVDELESRLGGLEDRTDLLQHVRQASALKPEERAALLIQTLVTEADKNGGRATMDANEAVKACHGDADRTNMYGEYGVFARAVDLVGNEDLLSLKQESRASSKNTRLVLDLDGGALPETVAGHEVRP
jgi:TolA-binding protein